MKPRLSITISIILFLLVGFSLPLASYAKNYEIMGQEAEDEGRLRKALTHYMKALELASEQSSRGLREKIIKLVQEIEPPPAVPEEAERYLARGKAAVRAASNKDGYLRAVKEFRDALRIAPWLADGYFNLGVVLDKTGKYDEAISNLKLFLIAFPSDRDARNLIYEIEYRKEDTLRAKAEDRQREEEQTQEAKQQERKLTKSEELEQYHLSIINGVWKRTWDPDGKIYDIYQFRVVGNDIEQQMIERLEPGEKKADKIPNAPWYKIAEGISFDGKKFTAKLINGGRTPSWKNWSLTVINDNLMIIKYYNNDIRTPPRLRDQEQVWRRER